MKNSFYLSKRIFLQHQFDNGISQLTNQNSDQSKFKLTPTNQNLNSLSMWHVYNLHHTSVFTYSHANTPLGQSERAYYLSYFINIYITVNVFQTQAGSFLFFCKIEAEVLFWLFLGYSIVKRMAYFFTLIDKFIVLTDFQHFSMLQNKSQPWVLHSWRILRISEISWSIFLLHIFL